MTELAITTPREPPARRRPAVVLSRVLFAVFNGPLLLLGIVGVLGGFLHSGHFWWASIAAVLLPATVVLLLVATVLTIIARRWVWAACNALVIVVAALMMTPFERIGNQVAPSDDDLVVMSFSVARSGETVEGLAQNLMDLLAEQQPDIVVLQKTAAWRPGESPGTALIADYVQPSLDSLGYVLGIPARLAERRTPLPVLARQGGPEILEQREGALADGELAGRYVRTRFRWQGRDAVLYNLHLRGYGAAKPWEKDSFPLIRPREWLPFIARYRDAFRGRAEEVRGLRARLDEETLPVVLAGDLNLSPRNSDYRHLARGRIDAFRVAGRGWGATYRGDIPVVRIDYVLLDRDFDVVEAHVPNVQFSDHRPVVARIRWQADTENGLPPSEISNTRGGASSGRSP